MVGKRGGLWIDTRGPGGPQHEVWAERELQLAPIVVDPIFGLHVVRVDVYEPTDISCLEVGALRVEEVVIRLQRVRQLVMV